MPQERLKLDREPSKIAKRSYVMTVLTRQKSAILKIRSESQEFAMHKRLLSCTDTPNSLHRAQFQTLIRRRHRAASVSILILTCNRVALLPRRITMARRSFPIRIFRFCPWHRVKALSQAILSPLQSYSHLMLMLWEKLINTEEEVRITETWMSLRW